MPHVTELISYIVLGIVTGALGGMLGIGGSIVMIPVLTVLLGKNQHVAQAAAMILHVFVSVPAMIQHHRADAVRWDVFWRMLPFGLALIMLGVWVSDQFRGEILERIFGVFLLYVVANNVLKLLGREAEPEPHEQRTGWGVCGFVGAVMGFMAGFLGIGGGVIAVPLLQRICNLPLRQCIATSSAVMCITAVLGAARKNMTLAQHGLPVKESLIIAACVAPTAILGGLLGARLTHVMPLTLIRGVFVLLLTWASFEMLGLLG